MAFRYKTATREEIRAHLAGLNAKRDRAKVIHLAISALQNFVWTEERKRGVRLVSDFANCRDDLIRLVEAELKSGIDHIHIPRRVAKAYIEECERS